MQIKSISNFSSLSNPQLPFMLYLQHLITGKQGDTISHCIFGGLGFPGVFEASLLLVIPFVQVNAFQCFFTNSSVTENKQN